MLDINPTDLAALRTRLRTRRSAALSTAQQAHAAQQFAVQFSQQSLLQNAQHIGVYLAVHNEADPAAIVKNLRDNGKQLYLPIVQTPPLLRFAPWFSASPLRLNQFNIAEPVDPAGALHDAATLDLLIMPLLAFTLTGIRLGMGGGYYDRSLTQHIRGKPLLVGLAYEFQLQDTLPQRSWDVSLDFVITEQSFYDCRA
ncbi:MAG: 5-formyltetrahydrofolate cyclo-ligase [Gammaproteobacteria bacterium]|nr:5-formyltetrahydrofolate cyclo-ligase [Gammaproteobacteria bacterium]